MNGSGFEKVLLSAMLTSCTVFSVLTLGFLPHRADPILSEPTAGQSLEDINQRDVVIRHIGLSIVVSVGAGVTTAELFRKWGRSRAVAPDGRQVLSAQTTLQVVDLPEMAIAVNGLAASLQSLTNGMMLADRPTLQPIGGAGIEPDHETAAENVALPLALFQPLMPLATAEVNWFPTAPDSTVPAIGTDWAPTWHPLLASREQYQICRVHRSDASERLLAILFDGQYYRFVKTALDHEQALRLATRLDQRGETAVITQVEERYTVWALEPEACPEATVPSANPSANLSADLNADSGVLPSVRQLVAA